MFSKHYAIYKIDTRGLPTVIRRISKVVEAHLYLNTLEDHPDPNEDLRASPEHSETPPMPLPKSCKDPWTED